MTVLKSEKELMLHTVIERTERKIRENKEHRRRDRTGRNEIVGRQTETREKKENKGKANR